MNLPVNLIFPQNSVCVYTAAKFKVAAVTYNWLKQIFCVWAAASWDPMIALWASYNQHIAFLMETIEPKFHSHTITIEGAGPFALGFIMPDYVEHLKHHLKQIFPNINLSNKFVDVYHS